MTRNDEAAIANFARAVYATQTIRVSKLDSIK